MVQEKQNLFARHAPLRILVTGAGGYVGSALVRRLAEHAAQLGIAQVTALDIDLDGPALPEHPMLRRINGSLGDPAARALALADAPDLVFHLAGITSGQAEREFDASLGVNVTATMALFEDLRRLGNVELHLAEDVERPAERRPLLAADAELVVHVLGVEV